MRTISFPAQNNMEACNIELPYSESADYTIFWTPSGYKVVEGIGNVLTGISGEKKVLEIRLSGKSGYTILSSAVEGVVVTDAADEEILDIAKKSKRAEIAAKRYELENAGIQINGKTVATDDRSKAMIMSTALSSLAKVMGTSLPLAIQQLTSELPDVIHWKYINGFDDITAEEILSMSLVVHNFVESLFARERTLNDYLNGITVETAGSLEAALEQIKSVDWDTEI
jgi:uncharacterized protein YidB (DUF937 family)